MATKFFSDGAVHAYFNPYETPYDAFMNYMNVLSDFEIRLRKIFPDTAEQDQIFKLGTQVIEKDMIIEKQVTEIEKLTRKIAKINPVLKPTIKKKSKPSARTSAKDKHKKDANTPGKKQIKASDKEIVIKIAPVRSKTKTKITKKTTPLKSVKTVNRNKK
jgi:alpha-amylase